MIAGDRPPRYLLDSRSIFAVKPDVPISFVPLLDDLLRGQLHQFGEVFPEGAFDVLCGGVSIAVCAAEGLTDDLVDDA